MAEEHKLRFPAARQTERKEQQATARRVPNRHAARQRCSAVAGDGCGEYTAASRGPSPRTVGPNFNRESLAPFDSPAVKRQRVLEEPTNGIIHYHIDGTFR